MNNMPTPDHGVFGISTVADLTGLHPQTLRGYEARGIVAPARTQGGTRRYSGNDITRIRRIATMLHAGLNLAGIERVLELEDQITVLQQRLRDRAGQDAQPSESAVRPARSR
jgi:DNA-binding transcriptional MerR regulator